ncbi:MAG: Fic family protein [Nanoarchaeota archaeon]|nr:Fic family protein [Nanoarchaeota archaeon]
MFVRKKKINGREYYYIVKSTRIAENKFKKFEHYIGLNKPSEKDIQYYEKEFDSIRMFLDSKKDILDKIKKNYLAKIKHSSKDELMQLEEEIITKFTYDTNRIEGSTLSYKDTKMLLEEGISPKEKPIRDIKEAENHKEAYIFIKNNLDEDITKEVILKLHAILKEGVTEDAGKFRTAQVRVGNFIPVKADMVDVEITNLIHWCKKNKKMHPLELSSTFHATFECVHPFFDGNGRVGRLLMNLILLKNKYPLAIIQNKNRRRYYSALSRADNGNNLYLIKYVFSEIEQQSKAYYN